MKDLAMRYREMFALTLILIVALLSGCHKAPQTAKPAAYVMPTLQPAANADPASDPVYSWQDVTVGQRVFITHAAFDTDGYQLSTGTGDTILVPFVNHDLYVMRFGRTDGSPYFVNENGVPTLYLSPDMYLDNLDVAGARWYPLPSDYAYTSPVYVACAPSWDDFTAMGWYPGMSIYGGLWSYQPTGFQWMPGFYINIGNNRYHNYHDYQHYYRDHPGYHHLSPGHNPVAPRDHPFPTTPRPGSGIGSRPFERSGGSYDGRPSSGGFTRPGGSFTPPPISRPPYTPPPINRPPGGTFSPRPAPSRPIEIPPSGGHPSGGGGVGHPERGGSFGRRP